MPDPADPTSMSTWSSDTPSSGVATESLTELPESLAWRSALAEALRANGFEVSPPAIDEDELGDGWVMADTDKATVAPDDDGPEDVSGWWADADEARQHANAWASPTPLAFTDPIEGGDDAGAAAAEASAESEALAEADETELADETERDAEIGWLADETEPDGQQADETEPGAEAAPEVLVAVAGDLGADDQADSESTVVTGTPGEAQASAPATDASDMVDAAAVVEAPGSPVAAAALPVPRTAVAPVTPAGAAPPSPPAFLAGRLARPAAAAAVVTPDPAPAVPDIVDPRDALEWPEPDLGAPEDADLGDLRAEATAWFAEDDAHDLRATAGLPDAEPTPARATAEHGWPMEDMPPTLGATSAEAEGSDAVDAAAPWAEESPLESAERALVDDAASIDAEPAWTPLTAPIVDTATSVETPEPVATTDELPPLLEVDAPPELDPRRVEFVGYQDAASNPPPARQESAVFTPPSGSITDIGRRPPGARPTASAAPRPDTDPGSVPQAGPAPTGADLWDMVTAPAASATAPGTSVQPDGRGSRAATVLLTVLVVLVILALVVGFLYSFTGLLGM